jgi:hypothetical protein
MIYLQESEQTLRGFDAPQQTGNGQAVRTIGEVATVKFGDLTPHIPARVVGIHLYNGKVKYDLELAIFMDDGWITTRIYNVDSNFVYYGGTRKS